jgi:hypothetical protein
LRYNFKESVGKTITLTGNISKTPWQHLIQFFDDRTNINYFDLDNGEQIVIYSYEPITCIGKMKIKGEVIITEGGSKRPQKIQTEKYIEYQLLVDTWECIE